MIETGKHSTFRGTICNKAYTMHRVFLSTVLRANVIFFSKHEPLMSAWVVLLFCKRHSKFMKSHTSGFKKPIKMIETGNTQHLKVRFVIEITTMRRAFLGTSLQMNSHFFFTHVFKAGSLRWERYKYPKSLNRKPWNVCKNISIYYAELYITLIFAGNQK